MPRRKQEIVSEKPKSKPRTKPKRVVVRRAKSHAEIDQLEIDKLRRLLDEEEKVIETELKHELGEILDKRDRAIKGELSEMDLKNRRLIMWIGVSLFMLSIVSFWISSLDTIIKNPVPKMYRSVDEASLDQAKENLSKNLSEVMKEIERLKAESAKLEKEQQKKASSTAEAEKDFLTQTLKSILCLK